MMHSDKKTTRYRSVKRTLSFIS